MSSDPRARYGPRDRLITLSFSPVLGSERDYYDLFTSKGFPDATDISIIDGNGQVRFASNTRADIFIEMMNGFTYKGQTMRCQRGRAAPAIKTLHISWQESGRVSERAIYYELSPLGFIRRITSKGVFAFVEFDTAEDAANALNAYKRRRDCYIDGAPVKISFAKREQRLDLQNMSVPLDELLPDDDPLWCEIQKRVMHC